MVYDESAVNTGHDPQTVLRPDELDSLVRRRLQAILAVVRLEVDGVPVEVDGFLRKEGRSDTC